MVQRRNYPSLQPQNPAETNPVHHHSAVCRSLLPRQSIVAKRMLAGKKSLAGHLLAGTQTLAGHLRTGPPAAGFLDLAQRPVPQKSQTDRRSANRDI